MVVRPRESSVCFAVHALRRTLKGAKNNDDHPAGTKKDFLVEKHLDKFVTNGSREAAAAKPRSKIGSSGPSDRISLDIPNVAMPQALASSYAHQKQCCINVGLKPC